MATGSDDAVEAGAGAAGAKSARTSNTATNPAIGLTNGDAGFGGEVTIATRQGSNP